MQPLVFLALFGPLLAGSLGGADVLGGNVWQWFVPAILVMTTLFGTATTVPTCCTSSRPARTSGCSSRPSLLIGRSLKEVLPLTEQATLLIVVMIPFGFQLHLLGALDGLALLGVLGIDLGSLSYALAVGVRLMNRSAD